MDMPGKEPGTTRPTASDSSAEKSAAPSNFIRNMIEEDIRTGRFGGRVQTRFPPEPNGYLHIGHAKSICLNYGLAQAYGGKFNLRFDDTNPTKEEQEYIDSILADVRWLGADFEDRLLFASDYFDQLYAWAVQLIEAGKAYVDDLSADEIREYRGTLTAPGKNSPYRDRPVAENLDLFARMKQGEFPDGSRVLRAKIDMASPNMNLRDPVMYRILHADHPRTGDKWCIYPMYDWAHGQSDSIEGITHSICTLEFEDHRPLYDWFVESLGIYHPQQIEFARLNINYTVMSKRFLRRLVMEGHVRGWDDPRMPTLSAMRRRGYTPEAIRKLCDLTGVSKSNSVVDLSLLEHCLRDHLNQIAPRVMAILNPLRVIIDNYPEDQVEWMEAVNNPEDPARRHAPDPVLAGAVHRAGRLHGGPAQEVLPPGPRPGSPPALRLLRHLRQRGEGRRGQPDRAALHLRSGDAGRRRARRAQGQGHAALGLGPACPPGGSAPLRARSSPNPIRAATAATSWTASTPTRWKFATTAGSNPAWRTPSRATASSSSGSATSTSIWTAPRSTWSSTAPSPCVTSGPSSSKRARSTDHPARLKQQTPAWNIPRGGFGFD